MQIFRRLRLRCFLLFTSLLMCCPLCYSLPCRNHDWPIIKGLWRTLIKLHLHQLTILLIRRPYYPLMVDQAGVEPASRTLFSLLHTAITYILLTLNLKSIPLVNFPERVGPLPSLQEFDLLHITM